jgi:DNA-directed RNA polymerase specialized sigma24 family protein
MFLPWRLSASDNPHEQAFVERLGKVLLWARQITSGDTALAEDLAQDAFLHFTTARPPLKEISSLDKYLYVVLKNLFRSHLASISRRSAVPFDPLAHENAMETW